MFINPSREMVLQTNIELSKLMLGKAVIKNDEALFEYHQKQLKQMKYELNTIINPTNKKFK